MTALAIDISTRRLGWCCGVAGANRLQYGLIELPGPRHVGKLYAAVRNSLSDLIEECKPAALCWCAAFFRDDRAASAAAVALNGVVAVAELVAFDQGVRCWQVAESTVRKAILGRGVFGERDALGKIVRGTGKAQAKAAALAWCARHGFDVTSDDVADSIVLHAYATRRLAHGRAA